MIMLIRRSNRSATAPASGPKISAGSSEVSQTPLTAMVPPLAPPRSLASTDSASRLSQSPRLDSDKAIQSRRNGLMDNTPPRRSPKGDLTFTAPAYRHSGPGAARTDEEIQIVFDRYKAAFYRLYNRELRNNPTLQGKMVLRLTIEPDGSVSMCALQSSDMDAPDLAAQVVSRVKTINFGAKDGVQTVTITYPIDFLPAT